MWTQFLTILISLYVCQLLTVNAVLPLIFPPTSPTRTQLIIGIGIPLGDLNRESLFTGYVLKAEYFLPNRVEQLKEPSTLPINVRRLGKMLSRPVRQLNDLEVNLTKIANIIPTEEDLGFLNQFYYTNSNRYQRMLKQINDQLLAVNSPTQRWSVYQSLVIYGDRMNLAGRECLLKSICEAAQTPLHKLNGLFAELFYILLTPSASSDALYNAGDYDYIQAEQFSRAGHDCHRLYSKCNKSLLDYISSLHHMLVDGLETFN